MMHVYVIGSAEAGPVKVGLASDLKTRLKHIQCHSPNEVRALHAVEVPDYDAALVEAYAHRLLHKHWMRGEWFSVPASEAARAIALAVEMTEAGIQFVTPARIVKNRSEDGKMAKRAISTGSAKAPFTVKNMPVETLRAISDHARAAGVAQGEWLARAIFAHAERTANA